MSAIEIMTCTSCYGSTYAYKGIAFEFSVWISAEFKIYLIKGFERLDVREQHILGRDIKHTLAKTVAHQYGRNPGESDYARVVSKTNATGICQ